MLENVLFFEKWSILELKNFMGFMMKLTPGRYRVPKLGQAKNYV